MKTVRTFTLLSGLIALHPLVAMIDPAEYPLQAAALQKAFPTKEAKAKEHRMALMDVATIEEQLKTLSTQIENLGTQLGYGDEIHGLADSLKTKAAILKALVKCGMDKEQAQMAAQNQ